MRAHGIGTLVTAVVLSAPSGAAQQREVLAGRVLDAAGERIAAAEILLVHRALPFAVGAEALDLPGDEVLRTRTGDDGRFRIEVQAGRGYSGFAWWTDAAGLRHATLQQEDLVPGSFVEFAESPNDYGPMPIQVQVRGLEAWRDLGPFSYRVVPCVGHPVALPVDLEDEPADGLGTLVLPPLPGNRGHLEILTGAGEVLRGFWVDPPQRDAAGVAVTTVIQVPPPVEVRLRLVEAGDGRPVVGATVRLRSGWLAHRVRTRGAAGLRKRSAWRAVGTTDAEGRITCSVPFDGEDLSSELMANLVFSAPGRADVHAGWSRGRPYVQGKVVDPPPAGELVVPMAGDQPIHGRLLIDGETPFVGARVHLRTEVGAESFGEATYWDGPGRTVTTDGEGRFTFPGAARGYREARVFVVPPLPGRSDAVEQLFAGLEWIALFTPSAGPSNQRDLGTIDCSALRRVDVVVTDQEGLPVRGARVDCADARRYSDDGQPVVWTDGVGRARLLLGASGLPRLLLVTHPTAGAHARVLTEDDCLVRLESLAQWTGRVLGPTGEPVAGAIVQVAGGGRIGGGAPLPEGDGRLGSMLDSLNQSRYVRADADGRFVLQMLPVRGWTYRLNVYTRELRGTVEVVFPDDPEVLRESDVGEVMLQKR